MQDKSSEEKVGSSSSDASQMELNPDITRESNYEAECENQGRTDQTDQGRETEVQDQHVQDSDPQEEVAYSE